MAHTVVVADDHPVVRSGLRAWFADSSIALIGEATNGSEAERLTLELKPAVLLLDVRMPDRDGLDCLRRLRSAGDQTPTLIYTGAENPTYAARASALGALGMVAKSVDRDTLIAAIERTAAGASTWSPQIARRLSRPLAGDGNDPAIEGLNLTAREAQVLKQLAFGLSNKEIALALGISYETVKEHVQHVLRKLGVSDRTQAAVWAVRKGLA